MFIIRSAGPILSWPAPPSAVVSPELSNRLGAGAGQRLWNGGRIPSDRRHTSTSGIRARTPGRGTRLERRRFMRARRYQNHNNLGESRRRQLAYLTTTDWYKQAPRRAAANLARHRSVLIGSSSPLAHRVIRSLISSRDHALKLKYCSQRTSLLSVVHFT